MGVPARKAISIAFVVDDQLSRERGQILMRVIQALKAVAHIELIRGDAHPGGTEAELLRKMGETAYHLVLLPWHHYLKWSRVEAHYGLTRSSGPTVAGYVADVLEGAWKLNPEGSIRAIVLDLVTLQPAEAVLLIEALADERKRSGLRPLLKRDALIYCETWFGSQGIGSRMDALMGLPELADAEWRARLPAMRICLSALWGAVYEEGPGKNDWGQAQGARQPRAYFQLGADDRVAAMRLCFNQPKATPKDLLERFWNARARDPRSVAGTLSRHADFVRAHTIAEAGDIEFTVGFLKSALADRHPEQVRTLWCEPLSAPLVTEIPFEAPGPQSPLLRALPVMSPAEAAPLQAANSGAPEESDTRAKERFIFNAAVKLRELKQLLMERDDQITELKRGGVGSAPPLPPPDPESLLDTFNDRAALLSQQIQALETQLADATLAGATPQAVETLRLRLRDLKALEQSWGERLQQAAARLRRQGGAP